MAKITSGETREGLVEGYLYVQTQDPKTTERDPDSSLFLRYVEQWSGELIRNDRRETHCHEWSTASLVFGRRRFVRDGEDVIVACENLSLDLFKDFIGRAIQFLEAIEPGERVPGNVTYAAQGFTIIVERDELRLLGAPTLGVEPDDRDYVTVLLRLERDANAVVFIESRRLAGFFVQVSEALNTLRGAESGWSRRSRRRR